ncbi:MAG: hypothetical protein QME94_05000, partial [Anaerolineae bacterium]|nr:hypothetical protein [Anaerolineae bacterium]
MLRIPCPLHLPVTLIVLDLQQPEVFPVVDLGLPFDGKVRYPTGAIRGEQRRLVTERDPALVGGASDDNEVCTA